MTSFKDLKKHFAERAAARDRAAEQQQAEYRRVYLTGLAAQGPEAVAEQFLKSVRQEDADMATSVIDVCRFDPKTKEAELWHSVCATGNTEIAGLLLKNGLSTRYDDDLPLTLAAKHGQTPLVKVLLDQGADINARHSAPLGAAALAGHTGTAEFLISRGADATVLAVQQALVDMIAGKTCCTSDLLTDLKGEYAGVETEAAPKPDQPAKIDQSDQPAQVAPAAKMNQVSPPKPA